MRVVNWIDLSLHSLEVVTPALDTSPVLVDTSTGRVIDRAAWHNYEIVTASKTELIALRAAGYSGIPDLGGLA